MKQKHSLIYKLLKFIQLGNFRTNQWNNGHKVRIPEFDFPCVIHTMWSPAVRRYTLAYEIRKFPILLDTPSRQIPISPSDKLDVSR